MSNGGDLTSFFPGNSRAANWKIQNIGTLPAFRSYVSNEFWWFGIFVGRAPWLVGSHVLLLECGYLGLALFSARNAIGLKTLVREFLSWLYSNLQVTNCHLYCQTPSQTFTESLTHMMFCVKLTVWYNETANNLMQDCRSFSAFYPDRDTYIHTTNSSSFGFHC
jgi:hypothetical protein